MQVIGAKEMCSESLHQQCPEGERTRDDSQIDRSGMVGAKGFAGAWNAPQDGAPLCGVVLKMYHHFDRRLKRGGKFSGLKAGLTAQRIFQDLRVERGYRGSYESVKRYDEDNGLHYVFDYQIDGADSDEILAVPFDSRLNANTPPFSTPRIHP